MLIARYALRDGATLPLEIFATPLALFLMMADTISPYATLTLHYFRHYAIIGFIAFAYCLLRVFRCCWPLPFSMPFRCPLHSSFFRQPLHVISLRRCRYCFDASMPLLRRFHAFVAHDAKRAMRDALLPPLPRAVIDAAMPPLAPDVFATPAAAAPLPPALFVDAAAYARPRCRHFAASSGRIAPSFIAFTPFTCCRRAQRGMAIFRAARRQFRHARATQRRYTVMRANHAQSPAPRRCSARPYMQFFADAYARRHAML